MHKENGARTGGKILSRLSVCYTSMTTNADQWKWRQIRISAVLMISERLSCSQSSTSTRTFAALLVRNREECRV